MKYFFAILIVAWGLYPARGLSQPISPIGNTLTASDSLYQVLQQLSQDRNQLLGQMQRLNGRIRAFENVLSTHVDITARNRRLLDQKLDTLQSLIPSEEPLRAANLNIIYLNRRQDSMMTYIGRLEERILELPDNQYWGVRNNFKNFDHLLLFTFLGGMMSLGVVLLVRTGKNNNGPQSGPKDASEPDQDADRMSIAITLLVGSILVVLFILFIL